LSTNSEDFAFLANAIAVQLIIVQRDNPPQQLFIYTSTTESVRRTLGSMSFPNYEAFTAAFTDLTTAGTLSPSV